MADPVPGLPPLLEAVLSVGTELELRATLQRIVDAAAELTGARYAALGMADPGRDGLVRIRTAEPRTTEPDSAESRTQAAHSAEPHTQAPDSAEPRTQAAPHPERPGSPEAQESPEAREADICLDVPIRVDDEVFGSLWLADKSTGPVTREDEQVVRLLANQAGIAIANARLYETARQRERWIEGAAAVTTALLSGGTDTDALLTVAERARILAGASAGIILKPTDEGGMEIVVASTPGDPMRHRGHHHRARQSPARTTPRRGAGVHRGLGDGPADDDPCTVPVRAEHDAAPGDRGPASSARWPCRADAVTARTPRSNACWPPSSPRRPRSPWSSPTHGTAANSSRCTRTGTASPGTCTIWSYSGCSRPA